MASPQWKNFQPPISDPAILAYHRSASLPYPGSLAAQNGLTSHASLAAHAPVGGLLTSNPIRETGIIEKICHSYGFIQCCDRDARLFFHFSEYSGNVDTMKIGDAVEFQMSYDRKTSKPIACSVVKLITGQATFEVVSDERVTGTVVTEAKIINRRHSLTGIQDGYGQLSYERNGECFFLPFAVEDVEGDNVKVKAGDSVTFVIAADKRSGLTRARKVRPLEPFRLEKSNGVVCLMKDNFGFIERADVVKEIFFHYSEFKGNINDLILGDDVEFVVQTRNNKEVATQIKRLAPGTVIFEDVSVDRFHGRVMKTLKSSNHHKRQSDPLAGRIVYETKSGQVEIPYGDKDQRGEYTLQNGDKVEFNIATDRRDKLQRATDIDMLYESFSLTNERREFGFVATLRDGYGFIRCVDREGRMFFHFSEVLGDDKCLQPQDELEFTVIQDPNSPSNTSREIAIRIRKLLRGSIVTNVVSAEKYVGLVDKEPVNHQSPLKNNRDSDQGLIVYDVNGNKHTIPYYHRDLTDVRHIPKYGDKVEFQISESKRSGQKTATNLKVVHRTSSARYQGFVATIKDAFGFIETADHDKEVFFHFSAFEGEPDELDLGDEVEYGLTKKTAKVSAEHIRKLPKGSVNPETVEPGLYEGRVIRAMRIINPDQDEYSGLVQLISGDEGGVTYPFGITSLVDKRDFLQKGDVVKFQLATVSRTGQQRATSMVAVRKMMKSSVDSVKGQFGFLNHEMEAGKKLFFHMSEVQSKSQLKPGDEVEFVVVHNQRNGKYSATNVRKISVSSQRPQRLMSRLKSVGDDSGPRLVVLRQPRGPDATKGFKSRGEA